jgi:hypothetical protein
MDPPDLDDASFELGQASWCAAKRQSEGRVFVLVPTGAEAQNQPPVGQGIDRCRHASNHRRCAQRDWGYERAELDGVRPLCGECERSPRFQTLAFRKSEDGL